LDHGEEVGGDLVVAGSHAAEVLQLEKKRSIKLRSAIEALAEARLRALVSLRRDFGRGALVLDQRPEAIGIVSLVCQRDGAWAKAWSSARASGAANSVHRIFVAGGTREEAEQVEVGDPRPTGHQRFDLESWNNGARGRLGLG
jgi:hypothetical protein